MTYITPTAGECESTRDGYLVRLATRGRFADRVLAWVVKQIRRIVNAASAVLGKMVGR